MSRQTILTLLVTGGFILTLIGFFLLQAALMTGQSPVGALVVLGIGVVGTVIMDIRRRYEAVRRENPVAREIDILVAKDNYEKRTKR